MAQSTGRCEFIKLADNGTCSLKTSAEFELLLADKLGHLDEQLYISAGTVEPLPL